MKSYFDAEMRLLNEAAIEFARSYPEQASMLNLTEVRDRDPYIERLLEGMAYLTAHIRSRIDDDVPEISQTLIRQMWPQFIRPFPSSTIIEFSTKMNQLAAPERCKKGTRILSDPVGEEADEKRNIREEKLQCEYRTVKDVVLNPIRINQAEIKEVLAGGSLIQLDFEVGASAELGNFDLTTLPLYLNGYPILTLDLWYYLTQQLNAVRLRLSASQGDDVTNLGGQSCVTPAHMDLDTSVLPKSGRSFVGTHLLHEYFCFREKFLFINLHGLGQVEWPKGCKKFTLEFHVDGQLPADYRIDEKTFRLHCTPAVNLFKAQSEPVVIDHRRSEYRVVADVNYPNSLNIYSVDSIESVGSTSGERHTYHSIHELKSRSGSPRHYHISNRKRKQGDEETFISVGGISRFETETLSCDIHAYNGHYPRRYLVEGSIRNDSEKNNQLKDSVELTNISRPTATHMPPDDIDYQWGVVAHLSLNYQSIAELDTLKRVLSLYEWTGRNENLRKIDGIKDVNLELYQEMYRGALMRGMEINLTLHEGNYASIADIALFGQILHTFFTLYANINTVVRTRVHCHPSGKELSWQPALGETSLM
ncbi:MAG: type VI secretion system baseplate subunit TssF [Candidatus Thiodiazotropha sp. (ex Monitilora ramsayi)]|nr:type VI secretion system baseplate subunit TssF [Candidatus Thiodiazotropha sp. (ex Monitilora ramsayi)]